MVGLLAFRPWWGKSRAGNETLMICLQRPSGTQISYCVLTQDTPDLWACFSSRNYGCCCREADTAQVLLVLKILQVNNFGHVLHLFEQPGMSLLSFLPSFPFSSQVRNFVNAGYEIQARWNRYVFEGSFVWVVVCCSCLPKSGLFMGVLCLLRVFGTLRATSFTSSIVRALSFSAESRPSPCLSPWASWQSHDTSTWPRRSMVKQPLGWRFFEGFRGLVALENRNRWTYTWAKSHKWLEQRLSDLQWQLTP